MTSKPSEGDVAQLGRYKLVSQIATGGMAEIYVARMDGYAGSNRLCVIKKIRPRIKADPRAVQMFLDEARIAATLQHPNIVQMFEVGEMDGTYFIAMEYLHGEDMRTVMRTLTRNQLQLPLDHSIHIAIDLLAGLHYAHEKRGIDGDPLGIVHRDVSPHNVFVTYDGAVKIVDFGIAKATNREHQTKVETLKGKIQYMSPEQCRCVDIDRRSDIFSVGVVLYELTTGRRLNTGDDEYEIMKRTVEGPLPRPTKVIEGYPVELENIVRMALAKRPKDRFHTALAMQQALENFAHDFRLRRSNIDLSRFMHQLFAERIESWERGMTEGTSIRQLVEARHETKGETSGPTFDSAVIDLDAPSGQLVTLSVQEEAHGVDARRRAGTTSELYPSLDKGDEYASAARTTPRLPKAEGKKIGTTDRVPMRDKGGRRYLLAAALILLCLAGGIAVGIKLNADAAAKKADVETTAADAGTAVAVTADAQVPAKAIDAAPKPTDAGVDAAAVVAKPGRLRIRGAKGASIYINGRRVGSSPKTISKLEPGVYAVELRKKGFETARRKVTVREGKTELWRARLEASKAEPRGAGNGSGTGDIKPPPQGPGRLAIKVKPSAQIFVDGKRVGFMTDWSRQISAGRHAVRVRLPESGLERTVSVNVMPGKTAKVICTAAASEISCRVR